MVRGPSFPNSVAKENLPVIQTYKTMKATEPKISICRDSKRYAFFDGFDVVQDFKPYTDHPLSEMAIIAEARAFFEGQSAEIVYPRVTRKTLKKAHG